MRKDLIVPHFHFAPPEPSPRLLETILGRIAIERRRAARRRFALFSVVLVTSAFGLVPAYWLLRAEFSASGFSQFLSLLFSNPGVALSYWQDFSLSLLELLPVAGLSAILADLLVFLGSLRATAGEVKHAFTVTRTA